MPFDIYKFELKPLPYSYSALEPHIDTETMYLHHDKHLNTYVENLNKALEKYPEFQKWNIEKLLKDSDKLPEELQTPVKNNAGGVYNHNLYFDLLKEPKEQLPDNEIIAKLKNAFGSYDEFKSKFKDAALKQFGSGYAWLTLNSNQEPEICATSNQDTPLTLNLIPILTIDVWEHSYYLKYQNKRANYIDNWFDVIDWNKVNERFLQYLN